MVTSWSDSNYNYTKTDHYRLFRSGSVGFANIPVDGSKKADDAYMEAVEPFCYDDAVEFNGAYLSGYMADKYDVSAEESIERANERVKNFDCFCVPGNHKRLCGGDSGKYKNKLFGR